MGVVTTYTVQDIKLAAYNQVAAPDNMSMAEQILFLKLSEVYRRFRSGNISKAEGDMLFKEAAREHEHNKAKLEMYGRILSNHADMWKQIETAAAAYVMSGRRTPEADAFVEAVYQCKIKPKGSDRNDS